MIASRKQLALIFGLGFIVGALVCGLWFRYGRAHGHHRRWNHERVLDKFSKELSLDPEQRRAVGALLEIKGEKMRGIYDGAREKKSILRAATRAEIRKLLREDQVPMFEAMTRRYDEKRARRKARRKGRGR